MKKSVSPFCGEILYLDQAQKANNPHLEFCQRKAEYLADAWDWFIEFIFRCPNHRFDEPTLMLNIYNGICHNNQALLDAASGSTLMSRNVNDAKSIIEHMVTSSSICEGVKDRPEGQLESATDENRRL